MLGLAACRHNGAGWGAGGGAGGGTGGGAGGTGTTAEPQATVELVVLGQARSGGPSRALARQLARTPSAGPRVFLWLGTDFGLPGPDRAGRCPTRATALAGPGLRELTELVREEVEAGASAWAVAGPDDWRCAFARDDLPPLVRQAAALLRIDDQGRATLASRCQADSCTLAPAPSDSTLELVLLDLTPWLYPELVDRETRRELLARQHSLLAALVAEPGPPRILVSAIPVETSGRYGLGGRRQRTALRYLPPFLHDALVAGVFAGAVGGLERSLQVSEDLAPAMLRGDRSFAATPVFQVVAGSAGGAAHTLPTSRSWSLIPELESEHLGFARLLVRGEQLAIRVHARVAGRWRTAALDFDLLRDPLPQVRQAPTIQPCSGCDPQSGAADGPVFVPRGERPR